LVKRMETLSKEKLSHEYWDLGKSSVVISGECGYSRQRINQLMQKYNVPTRRDLKEVDLSDKQKQLVVGSLLGDSSIVKTKQGKARLYLGHSEKQKDYLLWKNGLLMPFMTKAEIKRYVHKQGYVSYKTWSYVHPFFSEMKAAFYSNGKKIINKSVLNKYMTPLALSVWYMDDGCCKYNKFYNFATACFDYLGVLILSQIVKNKFNINILPYKNGKYIYVRVDRKQNEKFEKIISPYIIPSMSYKLIKRSNSVETERSLPDSSQVKLQSELHGNMQNMTEMFMSCLEKKIA